MFVWEAEVVEDITYSDSGIQPQVKTTSWYSFIGDFQKYGTADFVDHFGNNRGLCMKYTFPTTAMAQQYTSIKNLLNWTIPTFDQSWTPETSHYVTWQSKELNIYLRGCYSLQKSYLTEMLTRP